MSDGFETRMCIKAMLPASVCFQHQSLRPRAPTPLCDSSSLLYKTIVLKPKRQQSLFICDKQITIAFVRLTAFADVATSTRNLQTDKNDVFTCIYIERSTLIGQ